jgi:GNAT superfamily N-acetyltransferase
MIRPARDLDAGALRAILSEFVETTIWMPRLHSRAEDISFAAKLIAGHSVFVWEADRPLGFIALHKNAIDALYIRNYQHGQGYGSALVHYAQSMRGELELWTFQQNTSARRFYTKHGFSEVKFKDGSGNDEGLPDVCLTWRAH